MIASDFFTAVRKALGPLTQSQVDGFNFLLVACKDLSLQHAAYVLATAWHETARTMQPIAEYGKGKGKKYGKADQTGKAPYGRGYVQLTWRDNYIKADKELGLSGTLAANYDLALRPQIAADIIVRGMVEGWFTGKKLSDYKDYRNMRRIVNGTDQAARIAEYAAQFENALLSAGWGTIPAPAPQKPVDAPGIAPAPVTPPKPESQQAAQPAPQRGLLKAILDLLLAIFTKKG